MLAAVGLQIAAVAVLALVAGLTTGWESARFLLLGGAVAIIPNALFALRLALHRKRTPESYPVVFFLGEFAKLGLTVGLLAWVVKSVPDIRWLPLLIGLIVALKAPLFALAFVRSLPEAKGQSL
ncbi:MAG: ATP synthase subunit I [Burkholderiales bacterium]|nr:MAG: ATP synthase subunit I [Burkholderiales bacterium]